MSILHWINDGLITIFFLVVGMEIKGEVVFGELKSLKKTILPISAAVVGMIVPAISLGGSSIYTLGQKPDGTPWSVGIQNPRNEQNQSNLGVINLTQQAISTSGDYERFFVKMVKGIITY